MKIISEINRTTAHPDVCFRFASYAPSLLVYVQNLISRRKYL